MRQKFLDLVCKVKGHKHWELLHEIRNGDAASCVVYCARCRRMKQAAIVGGIILA